jgi:hypothetical protein
MSREAFTFQLRGEFEVDIMADLFNPHPRITLQLICNTADRFEIHVFQTGRQIQL